MELVKNYLKSNSSSSVTVMCNKLEISHSLIFALIESALHDLGPNGYRIIYAVNTANKILTYTEKNKKRVEDEVGKKGKIYVVQRVTEDIKSLFNSEIFHRDQVIEQEIKNGGLFLPRFSKTGGFLQERREYNNQKKLNFRPKKVAIEERNKEGKEKGEEVKIVKPPDPEFELEEEGIVRCPTEPAVMAFNRIIDLEIDDMDDIMTSEIPEVRLVKEVKRPVLQDSSDESSSPSPPPAAKPSVLQPAQPPSEPAKTLPKKRKSKLSETLEKKALRESIIPNSNIKGSKMIQPSLGAFFKSK